MTATAATSFLEVTGITSPLVRTTAEAIVMRDSLLDESHAIVRVASAAEAQSVGDVLKRSKELTRFIEQSRKDAKESPLQLCRDIDAHAKKLTDELDAEARRIGSVLAVYQAEQNRIAQEKLRQAEAEARKIREAQEREARKAEEIARKEYEEKMAAAERARTEAGAARREAEATKIREDFERDQEARALAARQQIIDTKQAAIATAPVKVAGVTTRRVLKFEVTDLEALNEAAPYLVKKEPNVAALVAALKGLRTDQHLPGIKHWYVEESVVR